MEKERNKYIYIYRKAHETTEKMNEKEKGTSEGKRDGKQQGTVVEMERRKEESVERVVACAREREREEAQAHVSMLQGWPGGS